MRRPEVHLSAQPGRSRCCTLGHWACKVPAQSCLQVIPKELRCSAYAFDRGIFGLLGAVAAPLVHPYTSPRNSVISSAHPLHKDCADPVSPGLRSNVFTSESRFVELNQLADNLL